MSKQVAILMSTYNGERYIKEQLNSIVNQTYKNWHLYIRDDGSTDDTVKILKRFCNQYSNITLLNLNNTKNLGVTASFMILLANTSADYYMFSDQDDFWKKDKIKTCISSIQNNDNTPTCVFTELQVVDKELKPIRLMNNDNVWFDFQHFLFGNCVTGCTMMINQKLKSILHIGDTNFDKIYLHDWWIAMIASAFGKLIYVKEPTILYRQHSNNVEGSKDNNLRSLIRRALHLEGDQEGMLKIFTMDQEFRRIFGNKIQGIDCRYLLGYTNLLKHSSFWYNLKLILTLPPKRAHLKGNILFSYLIIAKPKILLKA